MSRMQNKYGDRFHASVIEEGRIWEIRRKGDLGKYRYDKFVVKAKFRETIAGFDISCFGEYDDFTIWVGEREIDHMLRHMMMERPGEALSNLGKRFEGMLFNSEKGEWR